MVVQMMHLVSNMARPQCHNFASKYKEQSANDVFSFNARPHLLRLGTLFPAQLKWLDN